MPSKRTYRCHVALLILDLAFEAASTRRAWQVAYHVLAFFVVVTHSEFLGEDIVVHFAISLLPKFFVVLILALHLAVLESGGVIGQIVHTGHLVLSAVGRVIHLQLLVAHRVDAQREVSVEVEETQGQQSQDFLGNLGPEVEIVTVVEEEHEVGLGLSRQDNSAHVFNVVVAAAFAALKSVDVVRGLNVDAVILVSGAVSLQLLALVLDHDVLVGVDELLDHLIRHKFGTQDHS